MNQTVNRYQLEWKALEREETQPRFLRNVIVRQYDEFERDVLAQDPVFVKEVVDSLYSGDVYVLKGAFPAEFMTEMIPKLHRHGQETPSEFHKMKDGCPDFHREITPELAKNYALRQIKHSYYFFHWNDDPFKLLDPVMKRWGVFKVLGGLDFDAYIQNVPSSGVVDRLQIAHYPSGVGELELHSDPFENQKMAISGIMSKKGLHFQTGGAYILNEDKERVDVEPYFDIGDVYLVYPTVFHGVETIDRDLEVDWTVPRGRWFMGLYSNASDEYKRRHTCYGVEDAMKQGALADVRHKS